MTYFSDAYMRHQILMINPFIEVYMRHKAFMMVGR